MSFHPNPKPLPRQRATKADLAAAAMSDTFPDFEPDVAPAFQADAEAGFEADLAPDIDAGERKGAKKRDDDDDDPLVPRTKLPRRGA